MFSFSFFGKFACIQRRIHNFVKRVKEVQEFGAKHLRFDKLFFGLFFFFSFWKVSIFCQKSKAAQDFVAKYLRLFLFFVSV